MIDKLELDSQEVKDMERCDAIRFRRNVPVREMDGMYLVADTPVPEPVRITDPRSVCEFESNPYFNEFVARHAEWTETTFGPGLRTKGITNHIRKELIEIENEPTKLEEWIDVLLLALDGARRTGATGTQIMQELERKHLIVKSRIYPFPKSEDHPSEHIRDFLDVPKPSAIRGESFLVSAFKLCERQI